MGLFKRGGSLFGLRRVVGIHQGRERSDVLLTVALPGVLMLLSAYTNGWALTGGHLSLAPSLLPNTLEGLVRGVIIEGVVFACFVAVRALCAQGWRGIGLALVPLALGLVAVAVSAGCGLAWVARSGELGWMIGVVSAYLPAVVARTFQVGLGLLFPVALAVFALYDVSFIIHEHIKRGAQLGNLAVAVETAEYHQNMLREAQREANEKVRPIYQQIAQQQAQAAAKSAQQGDLSFGLNAALSKTQQLQSTVHLTPMAQRGQLPPAQPGPQFQQPFIPGQVAPAPYPPSGQTQQIQAYPPSSYNGHMGGFQQR